MTFVALWRPAPTAAGSGGGIGSHQPTSSPFDDAFVDACLAVTPHVVIRATDDGDTLVWVDARGLSSRRVAAHVLQAARLSSARAVTPADAGGRASCRVPDVDPGGRRGDCLCVGVSRVALAAEVAAREPSGTRAVTGVAPRLERAFLAPFSLDALVATNAWTEDLRARDVRLLDVRRAASALADAGVLTCGALAALAPDAVAVRLGAAGAALWRLARADDPRRIFTHAARDLPSASLEWSTYELRDPERLAFVAHRLVRRVVDDVRAWGESARTLVLRFALGDGGAYETEVRGARASADAAVWSRLVRTALERVTLTDGVTGLALRVASTSAQEAPQGDLFDRGFQSGAAAETAVARLVDAGAGTPVHPAISSHALPERRASWRPLEFRSVVEAMRAGARVLPKQALKELGQDTAGQSRTLRERPVVSRSVPSKNVGARVLSLDVARANAKSSGTSEQPAPVVEEPLALRLLPTPRPLAVTTTTRRGRRRPVRYRERLAEGARAPRGLPLVEIVTALGPDCLAVGQEAGAPVSREYWQCLTDDARLVLLYHDAAAPENESWFLQGWWD